MSGEQQALSAPDGLLGQLLGERYFVLRRLGQGGMGAVYEARHVLIDKPVAIKVLLPRYAADERLIARFHREALAAARAGSEHVIDVTDLGKLADGGWFIVFELLDGRDWAAELRDNGPQPLATVAHIACQVCAALEAAHERGIVHRDLKPGNIFLLRRGDDPHFVKVLDFGLAKVRDLSAGAGDGLTAPQAPLGTPEYMSPEQVEGRVEIDARSDLFALGVILFEALTGTVPFTAETPRRLMIKILSEPAPSLSQLRPELPSSICELVARLLEKDPERRPASCADVRRILLPFARPPISDEAPSAAPPRAVAPPVVVTAPLLEFANSQSPAPSEHPFARELLRRRRRAITAVAGGAVAVAALVLATALVRRDPPRAHRALASDARALAVPRQALAPDRAAARVNLRVDVQPETATITLDGAVVAAPEVPAETARAVRAARVADKPRSLGSAQATEPVLPSAKPAQSAPAADALPPAVSTQSELLPMPL